MAFFAVNELVAISHGRSLAKSGGPGTVVPGLPQNRT